jgi:hypothetical protein
MITSNPAPVARRCLVVSPEFTVFTGRGPFEEAAIPPDPGEWRNWRPRTLA